MYRKVLEKLCIERGRELFIPIVRDSKKAVRSSWCEWPVLDGSWVDGTKIQC